jgi:hypothetical protein
MAHYIRRLQCLVLIVICVAWLPTARADVPVGQFNFQFTPSEGVWDITGDYPNDEFDTNNQITLIQDDQGKITGFGTGTGNFSGIAVNLGFDFTGAIKTISDITRVLLTMKVSGTATNGGVTLPVRGSIKLRLDLDTVNKLLIGSGAGNLCVRGRCARASGPVQFDIPQSPQPMDGNWALALDLQSPDNKNIVGTGTATLSNGRVVPFTASGNYSATRLLAKLTLKGEGGSLKLQNDASPTSDVLGWIVTKAKVLGQKAITPDDVLSP